MNRSGAARFLVVLVALVACTSVIADGADLDAIAERLDEVSLDFDRAVTAVGFEMPLSYGAMRFESGILVPVAMAGDDRSFELVFVGGGRLQFEAPDDVEAQQLAYYTGEAAIDVPVERAVLISGDAGFFAGALGRAKAEVSPEARANADRLLHEWVVEAERAGFGADAALIRAAADDPLGRGYLGVWFESSRLGRGFYRSDPTELEMVALGGYSLFEEDDFLTQRGKRRQRRIERNRRKLEKKLGRPVDKWIEEEPSDEGDTCGRSIEEDDPEEDETIEWATEWVSARSPDAHPQDDPPGVEPDRYRIRMSLTGDDLFARGETVLRLRPMTVGMRVVTLGLSPSLEVCEILYEDDQPVSFTQNGWRVLVGLPEPTAEDEPFELTVRYAGEPIYHRFKRRLVKSTLLWHPRAGVRDRATYDVTLRWPETLSLVASGDPVDEGVEDGMRYTHRVLEVPGLGFSFEIGDYDVIEDEVGHMALTFAFPPLHEDLDEGVRTEIVEAVKASILLFESRLGLLPIDRFNVTVVPRSGSQGLLGFVTLSEPGLTQQLLGARRARLELIAHEISHQWWGNMVGWDNYRDQWLSESLATFSSARFMQTIAEDPGGFLRERAQMWRDSLTAKTFDGRPVSSVGPVVLGTRILGTHGGGIYHSIIYEKGAFVFTTLAERLGTDPTWEMLGTLAKAVNNRVIRTSTFFRALEQMSGQDLGDFVNQYVRGVGMPSVFYDYRVRRDGTVWVIEGHVRQLPAEQFRFVVENFEPGWDVVRHRTEDANLTDWTTVIPFYAETVNPDSDTEPLAKAGQVTLVGESSTFRIEFDQKPREFWLDPFGKILADMRPESFEPKRHLCELGEHLGRLGRYEESLSTLAKALDARMSDVENAPDDTTSLAAQELDARIHLGRARFQLDQGDTAAARSELNAAEKLLTRKNAAFSGERALLRTRIELRGGLPKAALATLNTYLEENDFLLDVSDLKIQRGEALALLAVASYQSGERDAVLLKRLAGVRGVDMRALHR